MSLFSYRKKLLLAICAIYACSFKQLHSPAWQSAFVKTNKDGSLKYFPDEYGNIIPDFSQVGYYRGDKKIPEIAVVKTISPAPDGNSEAIIQAAIDEVSKKNEDANGFKGAILLKKGIYKIPGSVNIQSSGIVLRGEGDETILIAEGNQQRPLINVSGTGKIEKAGASVAIAVEHIATGATSFKLTSVEGFATGDKIIFERPGTDAWIKDLKMDQIENRGGTRQWQAKEYDLQFERVITKISGNTITIDNPIMMSIEKKYGGGFVYKYQFPGRISHVGIENLQCQSTYASDTAEDHSWDAVRFDKIENGWVRQVTSRFFAFACVNLQGDAKFITVDNCKSLEPKSVITGGRRYSFCNNGQMNLFTNCHAEEGRHDYVTGARVCGPNVLYNCTSKKTHADIGPHHRWAVGTLYDNITTDGDINIQDRGNWGSGHGWAGVTQVVWNCTVRKAAVQNPWASGKNYCIGMKGEKYEGRLKGRPDAEWEGQNKEGLEPGSLYKAQLKARNPQPLKGSN
ncbi:hypothetical protein [Terrimonas pollutisoli]|uniref:hypothetical protein n=1 Tax=Terrimonas pollutisoli TaxID=3034147 RepID=UPI0023EDAA6D|nr:hypothetical protein [Terrimonas sp. H1YJ31]